MKMSLDTEPYFMNLYSDGDIAAYLGMINKPLSTRKRH